MSRILSTLIALLMVGFLAAGCKSTTSTTGAAAGAGVGTSALNGAAGAQSSAANSLGNAVPGSTPTSSTSGATCPTSNTTSFAKTKFVLHSGLAFGAFHRYVYKPYQARAFTTGSTLSKVKVYTKAGLAALFVKREVRLAYTDAQANPTLCKVIAGPLQSIGDKIGNAVSSLKSGDTSGITGIESAIQGVESSAANAGSTITEDQNAPLS
jgi:hypothetical protein